MELLDIIDLKELQRVQDTFALATGMAAVTVDMKGNFITKPSNFTDFCMKYTRQSPEGGRRCAQCDAEGSGAYFCHAGLMDFAEPIIIDGVQYANAVGGQVLPHEPDLDRFRETARELGIPEGEYIAALKKVNVRSEESIRAAAELMRDMVRNMLLLSMANRSDGGVNVLNQEISGMLTRSRTISSKTHDLKKVSTQQKLLSINAAIEAGRAGDAGKGFRIVANQMGELAENSTAIYETIMADSEEIYAAVKRLQNAFKQWDL